MTDGRSGEPVADVVDAAEERLDIGPQWHRQAENASWALAARDAAIEAGNKAMAARIAADARQAIAAAVDAGATPAELAWELDYPGGSEALDGPHIDRRITQLPTSTPARAATHELETSLAAAAAAAAITADAARQDMARQEQLARWRHDDHAATSEAGLDRTGPDDGRAR